MLRWSSLEPRSCPYDAVLPGIPFAPEASALFVTWEKRESHLQCELLREINEGTYTECQHSYRYQWCPLLPFPGFPITSRARTIFHTLKKFCQNLERISRQRVVVPALDKEFELLPVGNR